MPTLICDLRPQAADLLPEYLALREAGESLAILALKSLPAPLVQVAAAAALQTCFDNECIAQVPGATLPAWLALDDFHRVLMISDAANLTPAEQSLADALLAQGAEAIELLRPADALDLAQSWFSGRRTGTRLLR